MGLSVLAARAKLRSRHSLYVLDLRKAAYFTDFQTGVPKTACLQIQTPVVISGEVNASVGFNESNSPAMAASAFTLNPTVLRTLPPPIFAPLQTAWNCHLLQVVAATLKSVSVSLPATVVG